MSIKSYALNLTQDVKNASSALAVLSTQTKNKALLAMATAIWNSRQILLKENKKDTARARESGMAPSMLRRLELDETKLKSISDSLKQMAGLLDPVGRLLYRARRPNGLFIQKVSVPIGVIFIIFESRPNVIADCMGLCLKSGNGVILKGGREAFCTNQALFKILSQAAYRAGVPKGAFGFVSRDQREVTAELLTLSSLIGLVIPRGGEALIRSVAESSKIPVIKHSKGVCHVYVDRFANLKKAEAIVLNAKTQNPSVCNAAETLLVDQKIAPSFLPRMIRVLEQKNVEVRGCDQTKRIVPGIKLAKDSDWDAEYLDLILSIRVVRDVREAVEHIGQHGSGHSDAIVTENKKNAQFFTQAVDSSAVFVNASTRFNDGGEFGMGAEMGISTGKLHARGPMGLAELTSYKYVVSGNGQVRGG